MKSKSIQSLTKLADAAFEQAARKVIDRARETGTPVIVWKNESVTELEPQTKSSGTTSPLKRTGSEAKKGKKR